MLDESIKGWPEISYFKKYFLKSIEANKKMYDRFVNINFGQPKKDSSFHTQLFYLPDPDFRGSLPESSLFNLDTMKLMFSTFQGISDLIEHPEINVDFRVLSSLTER